LIYGLLGKFTGVEVKVEVDDRYLWAEMDL
jgi:hypothetical protein